MFSRCFYFWKTDRRHHWPIVRSLKKNKTNESPKALALPLRPLKREIDSKPKENKTQYHYLHMDINSSRVQTNVGQPKTQLNLVKPSESPVKPSYIILSKKKCCGSPGKIYFGVIKSGASHRETRTNSVRDPLRSRLGSSNVSFSFPLRVLFCWSSAASRCGAESYRVLRS